MDDLDAMLHVADGLALAIVDGHDVQVQPACQCLGAVAEVGTLDGLPWIEHCGFQVRCVDSTEEQSVGCSVAAGKIAIEEQHTQLQSGILVLKRAKVCGESLELHANLGRHNPGYTFRAAPVETSRDSQQLPDDWQQTARALR